MKQLEILFEEINIIDWYDGIVQAIAKDSAKSYLIILVKWDMKHSEKHFILLELETNDSTKLMDCFSKESKSTLEENWIKFTRIYDDFIQNYQKEVYFLSREPKINESYSAKIVKFEDYLSRIINYDIQNIIIC